MSYPDQRQAGDIQVSPERPRVRICSECETEFTLEERGAMALTCSPACSRAREEKWRRNYNAAQRSSRILECSECGKTFSTAERGGNALTCSPECSEKRNIRVKCRSKRPERTTCSVCKKRFKVQKMGVVPKTCSQSCLRKAQALDAQKNQQTSGKQAVEVSSSPVVQSPPHVPEPTKTVLGSQQVSAPCSENLDSLRETVEKAFMKKMLKVFDTDLVPIEVVECYKVFRDASRTQN
jgi:hypothetical protein